MDVGSSIFFSQREFLIFVLLDLTTLTSLQKKITQGESAIFSGQYNFI